MPLFRKTCNTSNICIAKNEQHCDQHGHLLDVDVKGSKRKQNTYVKHSYSQEGHLFLIRVHR